MTSSLQSAPFAPTERTIGIGRRLVEEMSYSGPNRSRLAGLVENIVNFDNYPSVIISEDASGRVAARIIKLFLEKLQRHYGNKTPINIPVLSYPQGRGSSEKIGGVHSNRIKRVLLKQTNPTKPVLIINDITVTGTSKRPLMRDLAELQKEKIIGTCFLLEETSNPDLKHKLGLVRFDLQTIPIPVITPESIHPVKRTVPNLRTRIKMLLRLTNKVTTLEPDNSHTYKERRLSQTQIVEKMFREFVRQHHLKFGNQF